MLRRLHPIRFTPRCAAPVVAALAGVGVFLAGATAAAQSIIRYAGDHPLYQVELEPHLLLGPFNPPGTGEGTGVGAGGRASIEIVKKGFVETINDSVAIGFGLDLLHYSGGANAQRATCVRSVPPLTGGGPPVCVEVQQNGSPTNYAVLPVVMQWNFYLTRKWSVFGEPGLAFYWDDFAWLRASPVLYLGGRYHFTDKTTLTLRLGYPTFSLGVSFFL
ncbi:MAG: hypothetical protein ABTD50_00765 [Polyangiaceae bacterium]|jgi:hypothetical protein